jgi:hypothetical protein
MLMTIDPRLVPKSRVFARFKTSPSFTQRVAFYLSQTIRSHRKFKSKGSDKAVLITTTTRQKITFAFHYSCYFTLFSCTCLYLVLDYQIVLSLTSKFRRRKENNFLIPNNTLHNERFKAELQLSEPNSPSYHHNKNILCFIHVQ